jgi:type III secretion HrpO family protein
MEPNAIAELANQAVLLTILISAPFVLAAAFVGLLIGFLQALMQLQEQTIVYALKVAIVFALIVVLGGWASEKVVAFGHRALNNIVKIR